VRHSWFVASIFGLLLGACATTSQIRVTAEVDNPTEAKARSVAVVPDVFMEDPVEADRVAGLIREQLVGNGFTVQETESEAELVVIPTVIRSKPVNAGLPEEPRVQRSVDVPYGLGPPNMMESGNALRHLGFEFATLAAPERLKVGIIVTALSRSAWANEHADQTSQNSRVWRIIAVSPLRNEDVIPKLVAAVGSKLNEVAVGVPSKVRKPQYRPAATPKKRSPQ
jgi:hypothetical protein